jgi:hypothetical protein
MALVSFTYSGLSFFKKQILMRKAHLNKGGKDGTTDCLLLLRRL